MRLKLQTLITALKSTTPIHLAVLRATSQHPSTSPPSPPHIAVLLSFGSSSRLTASSLISALKSRLHSTHNPSVALKSLLSLHILFTEGAFIIKDQIFPAFSRHPGSGRNPLALSSFRSEISLSLSAWVRWFARVLELILISPDLSDLDSDRLIILFNHDLVSEIELLVAVIEEILNIPEGLISVERNQLVIEIVKQTEEDWVRIEKLILLRVKETKERVGLMSFSDSVELLCVLNRVREVKSEPLNWKWMAWDEGFLKEVIELKMEVEELVISKQKDERKVCKSESVRVLNPVRFRLKPAVQFSSTRWSYP